MWSRDGRVLVYEGDRGLLAVDVESGPTFRIGRVRPYLALSCCGYDPVRMPDLFADGSVVLAVPDPSSPEPSPGATRIQVVLNFVDDMKRRVGR